MKKLSRKKAASLLLLSSLSVLSACGRSSAGGGPSIGPIPGAVTGGLPGGVVGGCVPLTGNAMAIPFATSAYQIANSTISAQMGGIPFHYVTPAPIPVGNAIPQPQMPMNPVMGGMTMNLAQGGDMAGSSINVNLPVTVMQTGISTPSTRPVPGGLINGTIQLSPQTQNVLRQIFMAQYGGQAGMMTPYGAPVQNMCITGIQFDFEYMVLQPSRLINSTVKFFINNQPVSIQPNPINPQFDGVWFGT